MSGNGTIENSDQADAMFMLLIIKQVLVVSTRLQYLLIGRPLPP